MGPLGAQVKASFPSTVIAIVLFALFALVAANGNGQPGCQTDEEMNTRDWRNNWDPTRFWRCENRNVNAAVVRCEDIMGFPSGFMSGRGCVDWEDWVWVQPVNPPSAAV